MSCFDVLGYTRDGCAYCDECGAGLPDDGETSVFFGDTEDADGMACGDCGSVIVDGEWWPQPDAVDPALVRWSCCSACNGQRPWRLGTIEYRSARRDALRSRLVCSGCRRPTVHFGGDR